MSLSHVEKINEKIRRWSQEQDGQKYLALNGLLDFLGDNLFYDYEPTNGPYPDFISRLSDWLENVTSDEEQQILFELVPKLFYIGREEFNALYRSVFQSIIIRWLTTHLSLKLDSAELDDKLEEAINQTWFCPISDSFRINPFYHINQITSKHTFRPDWRSLKKFGDVDKIKKYIDNQGVKYLVLLEDFVGTGTQACPAIKFALELKPDLKVLFIPLVICPTGVIHLNEKLSNYENFSFIPSISLSEKDLINLDTEDDSTRIQKLKEIVQNTFSKVSHDFTDKQKQDILPFGFRNTGALSVMYTNTPNNSLPIIYSESTQWKALFLRHSRT